MITKNFRLNALANKYASALYNHITLHQRRGLFHELMRTARPSVWKSSME